MDSKVAMSIEKFDGLGLQDFENGAVLEEIREALKQRQRLMGLCGEMIHLEELDQDIYDAALFGRET